MISDDDLLLYYYRDGLDAAERARIGAALAEQPEVAQRLHRLIARLDAAAAIPEVPVPAETLTRWRAALDQAATNPTARAPREIRRPLTNTRWLAAAAVLLIAIVSVFQYTRTPEPGKIAEVPAPNATDGNGASAYERGLKSHLASTEQQLASLESATPEDRKRLIETIVEQNRIYALAADRAGEPQLARVLRAFSPVLESMKQRKGDPSAGVAQLAFELRVMQGQLGAGTAPNTQSTTL
jgi:negative regulator of sigma E activity